MGVKDLWNILGPSCEKKSLWELNGLTIAIDLSSWIVDSQNIGEVSQVNMYLRNLFFRTSYLLLLGVKPIFILEGKAPVLKFKTIAKRLTQNRPDETQQSKITTGNRGRLNCLQKRCEELLLSLGVRCYKSDGEAEALCAKLNETGVVDAVISQDSDCFLYGARVVLRNFTMSPEYTCDMYTMENIESRLGLGRQKLLALSLLCGCDYDSGVQGIGKQSAVKFLATLDDDEVLDRLREWRNDDSSFSRVELSRMNQEEKQEYKIRKKALLDPNFPSEEVISEFLTNRSVQVPEFVWSKPSLPKFMLIAEKMLAWEESYTREKMVPLITRWHLLHGADAVEADGTLALDAIVKKRAVRGVPSYELRWRHRDLGDVISVEPRDLVASTYPDVHDAFVKSKEKPKKATKGRKKKTIEKDLENVETLFENLDIKENKEGKSRKKKAVGSSNKGLQTIDRFFLKDVSNERKISNTINHSTPIKQDTLLVKKSAGKRVYHYFSDGSDVDNSTKIAQERIGKSKSLESITDESLQSRKNAATEKPNNFPSFLDNTVDSFCDFDLSEIVNSIVTRPCSNPALSTWSSKNS